MRYDPSVWADAVRQVSIDEVKAAAEAGTLPSLAQRLARDENWISLGILFAYAGGQRVSLEALTAATRAIAVALGAGSGAGGDTGRGGARSADAARGVLIAAAEAILRRVGPFDVASDGGADTPPALGPSPDLARQALSVAAGTLRAAGEPRRAALAFERAGDDVSAAETYGLLGDLDKMEACLLRDEQRRAVAARTTDAVRRFEILLASGDREAAVAAVARIPEGSPGLASARERARFIDSHLCRRSAITLRFPGARSVRFAAVPAVLGRDALAGVPIRDAGASRLHATISQTNGQLIVEDAGSRAGTFLDGLPIAARLPLPPEGELGLGGHCRLGVRALTPLRAELRGLSGLDRGLFAIVGPGPFPLADVAPEAAGLTLALGGGSGAPARVLRDPPTLLKIDGGLMGAGCDLMHGDVLEIVRSDGVFRIEVT